MTGQGRLLARGVLAAALVAFAVAPSGGVASSACTRTFDGGAGTDSWHTAANWSGDVLPGASDVVCIGAADAVRHSQGTTTIAVLRSSGVLTISGGILAVTATSEPSSADRLSVTGGLLRGTASVDVGELAWSGGSLDGAGGVVRVSRSLDVQGNFGRSLDRPLELAATASGVVSGGNIVFGAAGRIENAGSLELRGAPQFFVGNNATIGIGNTGTLVKTGAGESFVHVRVDNNGTTGAEEGTLRLQGAFPSYDATTRTHRKGVLSARSTLVLASADIAANEGGIVMEGPAARILDARTGDSALRSLARNGGQLRVTGGADLRVPGDLANSGDVAVGRDSRLALGADYHQTAGSTTLGGDGAALAAGAGGSARIAAGVLDGAGAIAGDLVSDGTLRPDGVIAVTGDFMHGSTGRLEADVRGPGPGAGYDQLAIAGAASLDGELVVTTAPAFDPAEGDTLRLLRHSSREGTFARTELGRPAGGDLLYQLRYGPEETELVVGTQSSPSLTVADVSVQEGDAGTVDVAFTLEVDAARERPMQVAWSTSDGNAVAGEDYEAADGVAVFEPGETRATVVARVLGDQLDEADETFSLELRNGERLVIADTEATATILDDDDLCEEAVSRPIGDDTVCEMLRGLNRGG